MGIRVCVIIYNVRSRKLSLEVTTDHTVSPVLLVERVKMGCATSQGTFVESGKNLVETTKETAGEMYNKGEVALHDMTENVKDTVVQEMDNVKTAMGSAINVAEKTINSTIIRLKDTFDSSTEEAPENNIENTELNGIDETMMNVTSETAEAVSQAETVEAETLDGTIEKATKSIENEMTSAVEDLESDVTEEVEMLTDSVNKTVEDLKVAAKEELVRPPTPVPVPAEEAKEE